MDANKTELAHALDDLLKLKPHIFPEEEDKRAEQFTRFFKALDSYVDARIRERMGLGR
jgi:hypothetical protein